MAIHLGFRIVFLFIGVFPAGSRDKDEDGMPMDQSIPNFTFQSPIVNLRSTLSGP
ncbi:hypothetical protein CCACVL1_15271 [Corchorus capsularis]|uniref:Uncharacterized protein n=1 Tax=Corchorus capsularis TaxID=210143 RepID=A0A1R3I326_COCAP|nr:hypothetical protein CCACVL1_15271 [Corchorus capsularis]